MNSPDHEHEPLQQRIQNLENALQKLDQRIEEYESDPSKERGEEAARFAEDDIGMQLFFLGIRDETQEQMQEPAAIVYAKITREKAQRVLEEVQLRGCDFFTSSW